MSSKTDVPMAEAAAPYVCRARQKQPLLGLLKPGEPVAVDVEFQEWRYKWQTGSKTWKHRIGRVAVVNTRCELIYDTFCHYPENDDERQKLPPPEFGVSKEDLQLENGAKHMNVVERELRKIFDGRIVIGSGLRLDKKAIPWSSWEFAKGIWDAQVHLGEELGLKDLLAKHVQTTRVFNWHDPAEDAHAAMLLYLKCHPGDLVR